MLKLARVALVSVAAVAMAAVVATADGWAARATLAADPTWLRQFGTDNFDYATGVGAASLDGATITGRSWGSLDGAVGDGDLFLRRYGAGGVVLWTRQFGFRGQANARDVAVDGAGNSIVVGEFQPTDDGWRWSRNHAFIRKYAPDGSLIWARTLRTKRYDSFYAVAVDAAGNAYAAGYTEGAVAGQHQRGGGDVIVRKYSPTGAVVWTRQFGGRAGDEAWDVAVTPDGELFVAGGGGAGFLGNEATGRGRAFLRKYRPDGRLAWTRHYGRGRSIVEGFAGVAVDGTGSAIVVASQDKRDGDVVVRKYSPGGQLQWNRWFGTGRSDSVDGVAVGLDDAVYVAGTTQGRFQGQSRSGGWDVFVRKIASGGRHLWTDQFGSPRYESVGGIATDDSGRTYTVGETEGRLPGQTRSGLTDGFIAAYTSDQP